MQLPRCIALWLFRRLTILVRKTSFSLKNVSLVLYYASHICCSGVGQWCGKSRFWREKCVFLHVEPIFCGICFTFAFHFPPIPVKFDFLHKKVQIFGIGFSMFYKKSAKILKISSKMSLTCRLVSCIIFGTPTR